MKQYDIYLRNRITELDVAIRELSIRDDISIRVKLSLLVNEIITGVEKFVSIYGDGELATTALESSCGATAKTVYEHMENISKLVSEVDAAITSKATGEIRNDMRLENRTITLLQEWFYSCSVLRNALISSDVDAISTAYVGVESESNLLTENISPAVAEKMAYSLKDTLTLTYSIGCALEYLLGAEHNKLTLSSTVNALLARYRLLGEMDKGMEGGVDLTLEEFDDIALEDIDFVVIE